MSIIRYRHGPFLNYLTQFWFILDHSTPHPPLYCFTPLCPKVTKRQTPLTFHILFMISIKRVKIKNINIILSVELFIKIDLPFVGVQRPTLARWHVQECLVVNLEASGVVPCLDEGPGSLGAVLDWRPGIFNFIF